MDTASGNTHVEAAADAFGGKCSDFKSDILANQTFWADRLHLRNDLVESAIYPPGESMANRAFADPGFWWQTALIRV